MTVSEMTQMCGDGAGWRSGIQGVHSSQAQTSGENQGIQPELKCVSGQSGMGVSGEAPQGNDALGIQTHSQLLQVAFISRVAFCITGKKPTLHLS